MPHKRAKRSARERDKQLRGVDLAPKDSLADEPIPKSVSRVLDSARITREFREKKRKLDDGDDGVRGKRRRQNDSHEGAEATLQIKPGETIAHFNKRVEGSMIPLIKTALRHSSSQQRKIRKQEARQGVGTQSAGQGDLEACSKRSQNVGPVTACDAESNNLQMKDREFLKASTATPRRLHDIAQAPPEITKFPRGSGQPRNDKSSGVLSMAQKVMMEEEREKAIKHYRELKARRSRGDAVVKSS